MQVGPQISFVTGMNNHCQSELGDAKTGLDLVLTSERTQLWNKKTPRQCSTQIAIRTPLEIKKLCAKGQTKRKMKVMDHTGLGP